MTIHHTTPAHPAAHPAGHPFHDPREWEGPYEVQQEAELIREGDLVQVLRGETLVIVQARAQDGDSRWRDAAGALVLASFGRLSPTEFWRIPSPGPEPLPTQAPALVTDVLDSDADRYQFLMLGPDGIFYGAKGPGEEEGYAAGVPAELIIEFADEAGTRWSRDESGVWAEAQA